LGAVYLIFVDKLLFMILLEISLQDVEVPIMIVVLAAIAWLLYEFIGMKSEIKERNNIKAEIAKLRLQAYERLTVFAERASLKNLVARTPYSGMSVVDVQLAFIEALRSEYEYNVSQQIYVSAEMWKAMGNLTDQNIYIINQVAAVLPPQAAGIELSKRILEYASMKNADLSILVLEALQFEAKQIF
jgi:hypothetical protein